MSRKTLIKNIDSVIIDTFHIIKNPELKLSKDNRIFSGVRSYTRNCVLCVRENKICPPSCYMGTNKSCLKLHCHPHGETLETSKLIIGLIFWTRLREILSIQHDSLFRLKNRENLWQLIADIDNETYMLYNK